MVGYKNIDKKAKLELRDQLTYQQGQVVSKTLVQNDAVSVTLFSMILVVNTLCLDDELCASTHIRLNSCE